MRQSNRFSACLLAVAISLLELTLNPGPTGVDAASPATSVSTSQYHALAPSRVMDTRVSGGGVGPNETRDLQVYGQGGVPNSSSVSAVVLNVAVTDTSSSSFLRLFPQGSPTSTANLNWMAGTTISNLVTVPVNTTNGTISIYNHSGWTSVVVDVQGYYQNPVADHSGLLAPLVPCRLMDTRDGTGGRGNPLGTDTTYNLPTLSRCGIPASGVSALVLNVAATNTSTSSFLTVFPTGQALPTASNLNFSPGQTIPNRVIARLGTAGNVSLYNHYGNVDVVVDVGGYFTDASSSQTTGSFIPVSPTRILDTRDGTGGFVHPLGNDSTITVSADVPSNATAVVLNVAATDPSSSSFVTAYPSDVTRPSPASDLNFSPGQTIPNAVIIKLSGTGTFSLYNHTGSVNLVADVFGYYSDPDAEPHHSDGTPTVNAPHFNGSIDPAKTAVFWYGKVNLNNVYSDGRVGYNNSELYISLSNIDHYLVENGDAVTLFLDTSGASRDSPTTTSYQFNGYFKYQSDTYAGHGAYRGTGSTWSPASIAYTYETANRFGDGGYLDAKGWVQTFHIPFSDLGVSPSGTWNIALTTHNQNSPSAGRLADEAWPSGMESDRPATWGNLHFGLPTFTPPSTRNDASTSIRQGLNGQTVTDNSPGGGNNCGSETAGDNFFPTWGNYKRSLNGQFDNATSTIENESDISDWNCFSKYYINFPLRNIPQGKVVKSATLTLCQTGNFTTPNSPSWIQVLTTRGTWSPSTMTWNNAPYAQENTGGTVIDPITAGKDCPGSDPTIGVKRTLDVSYATATAVNQSEPSVTMILYESDTDYNSGKYFSSCETDEKSYAAVRPTLTIFYGDPT